MSAFFDPFEARMQLLSLLRKLNASQQSIQKVVSFAIKYGSRCGDDLWDCMLEECEKGSLNTRINVLYLLDTLCETSLYAGGGPDAPYLELVTRDLDQIIEFVVPPTREGVLNLLSAKQILETWRTKRLIRPELVEKALEKLEERKSLVHVPPSTNLKKRASTSHFETFSHNDMLRRMEEDRERHKRLRERIWVLPIPMGSSARGFHPKTPSSDPSPSSPSSPTADSALNADDGAGPSRPSTGLDVAVDLEFEQAWETTSDLNEDDLAEMEEENVLAYQPPIDPIVAARELFSLHPCPSQAPPISHLHPPDTPGPSSDPTSNNNNDNNLSTSSAAVTYDSRRLSVPHTPRSWQQPQPPSLTVTNPTPTGTASRSPQLQTYPPGTPTVPSSTATATPPPVAATATVMIPAPIPPPSSMNQVDPASAPTPIAPSSLAQPSLPPSSSSFTPLQPLQPPLSSNASTTVSPPITPAPSIDPTISAAFNHPYLPPHAFPSHIVHHHSPPIMPSFPPTLPLTAGPTPDVLPPFPGTLRPTPPPPLPPPPPTLIPTGVLGPTHPIGGGGPGDYGGWNPPPPPHLPPSSYPHSHHHHPPQPPHSHHHPFGFMPPPPPTLPVLAGSGIRPPPPPLPPSMAHFSMQPQPPLPPPHLQQPGSAAVAPPAAFATVAGGGGGDQISTAGVVDQTKRGEETFMST